MESRGLLNLPPCFYLALKPYLDASSKYNLSRTCTYLGNIMNCPSMWRPFDNITANCLDSVEQTEYIFKKMNKKIRHLLFRGKGEETTFFPQNFFKKIRTFKNLTVIALEKVHFNQTMLNKKSNVDSLSIDLFPESLEELSLKGSTFENTPSVTKCKKTRAKMRVIILDECNWLITEHFQCFKWYPNLEVISLVDCSTKKALMLPDIFHTEIKNIKIIDMRSSTFDYRYLDVYLYYAYTMQAIYLKLGYSQDIPILNFLDPPLDDTLDMMPPRSVLYTPPNVTKKEE